VVSPIGDQHSTPAVGVRRILGVSDSLLGDTCQCERGLGRDRAPERTATSATPPIQ